jgi:hypothetical protein
MPEKPKLLDQLRNTLHRKYYSKRIEKAQVGWNKRFIYRQAGRLTYSRGYFLL